MPFLAFSSQLEPWIVQQVEGPSLSERPLYFGLAVAFLLIADILLPIPSSLVCTLAGSVLGSFAGTLVCWVGLNLSALFGYFLARWFGQPFVNRFSDEAKVAEAERMVNRFGTWGLALCRALPVLAEASVLFVGLYNMSFRRFWPPVVAANLGIAISFCVLGDIAKDQEWLAIALAVSVAIPVALILSWSWIAKKKSA